MYIHICTNTRVNTDVKNAQIGDGTDVKSAQIGDGTGVTSAAVKSAL